MRFLRLLAVFGGTAPISSGVFGSAAPAVVGVFLPLGRLGLDWLGAFCFVLVAVEVTLSGDAGPSGVASPGRGEFTMHGRRYQHVEPRDRYITVSIGINHLINV